MKYNSISNFPTEVDSLLFFHDITIKDSAFQDKYQALIKSEKYDDAIALNHFEGSGVFTYTSGLFNLFINRIKSTQEYLKTNEGTFINREVLSNTQPADIQANQIWIVLND